MNVRKLERDEIGKRGEAIYEKKLRSTLEQENRGLFVAIDVETGAYEVEADSMVATDRLLDKHPEAQVYVERIGFPAAFHAYHLESSRE